MKTTFQILFAIISILFIISIIKIVSDRSTISDLRNELKLKIDSLADLSDGYADAHEAGLLRADTARVVRLGDTMSFNIFAMAYNTHSQKKPYVVLYKNLNFDSLEFSTPYDTIEINRIEEPVKFKTYKVGANTFGGIYFYPYKGKYRQYPLFTQYVVIDSLKVKRTK